MSSLVPLHSVLVGSLIIKLVLELLGTQERTSADACTVMVSSLSRTVHVALPTCKCSWIRWGAVEAPNIEGVALRLVLHLKGSSLETLSLLAVCRVLPMVLAVGASVMLMGSAVVRL